MNDKTPIFLEKPEILIDPSRLFNFIPFTGTVEEKLNSSVRFSIYLCILLLLLKQNARYLYIPLATVVIIYFFYNNNKENFTSEGMSKENENENENGNELNTDLVDHSSNKIDHLDEEESDCQEPTRNNPFMNILLTDDFSKKKKACNYTKKINDKINKIFNDKLFIDEDLVYNKDFNQRQFYTAPVSSYPEDQETFAKWLYQTPVTCAMGDNIKNKSYRSCNLANVSLNDMTNDNEEFYCLKRD